MILSTLLMMLMSGKDIVYQKVLLKKCSSLLTTGKVMTASIEHIIGLQHLFKHLHEYIEHCSDCQFNQIKCYLLYEFLHSISLSTTLFHTISIDFVVAVSEIKDRFNVLTSNTCKFFKHMLLISDIKT